QPGAAADEPVRGDGARPLGPVASGPVRGDRGPGELLFGPGEPGGGAGQRARLPDGRGRPARGGIPGEGGPAGGGQAPGRTDRAERDDPAGTRTGGGRGQPGQSQRLTAFLPRGQEDLAPAGAVSR